MEQKISEILRSYEHKIIPGYFYDDSINFIAALTDNQKLIFTTFNDICGQENIENQFQESDFACEFIKMDEKGDWLGAKLHFPLPSETPLCYEMYLFFDREFKRKGCYTLEFNTAIRKIVNETPMPNGRIQRHTTLRNENCGFLCSWTKEQVHNNYGSYFFDQGINFFSEAFSIHLHRFENETDVK